MLIPSKQIIPSLIFTVVPCTLIISKFYCQRMYKRIVLKGVLKFTLKQLLTTRLTTPMYFNWLF